MVKQKVHQQNVAEKQEVSYVAQSGPEGKVSLNCRDSELEGNAQGDLNAQRDQACRAVKEPAAG